MKGYVPLMPVDFGTPPRPPHAPWWVPFFVLLCIAVILYVYTQG